MEHHLKIGRLYAKERSPSKKRGHDMGHARKGRSDGGLIRPQTVFRGHDMADPSREVVVIRGLSSPPEQTPDAFELCCLF